MPFNARRLLTIATIGTLLSASAAFATTTVSRCNFEDEGSVFVPGVRVCSPTKITDIKIGSEGLTREIFYDDEALLNYAASKFGLSARDLAAGVCTRCDTLEEGKEPTQASDYNAPTEQPTEEPNGGATDEPNGGAVDEDAGGPTLEPTAN